MTDYFDQLVERTARAMYEAAAEMCPGDDNWPSWDSMDADEREHWYIEARAGLTTALALDLTDPCPTCGGTRFDPEGVPQHPTEPCPDCQDEDGNPTGRVPASVRLMLGEQVGVIATEPTMNGEHRMFTSHVRPPQKYNEYEVYRAISPEDTRSTDE